MKLIGKGRLFLKNAVFAIFIQCVLVGYTTTESNAEPVIVDLEWTQGPAQQIKKKETTLVEQEITYLPRVSINFASPGKSFIGNHIQGGVGVSGFFKSDNSFNLKYSLGYHGDKITLSYAQIYLGHAAFSALEYGVSYIRQASEQPDLFNGNQKGIALELGFLIMGLKLQV